MGKHAYLIMAHGLVDQLALLIKALDHERNDIYLHIDKKSTMDVSIIKKIESKSNIYFSDRINVAWGGVSIVKAELILLQAAVENGPYDFYHLLSGQDFPLKSQQEILDFFDKHKEYQFISCNKLCEGKDDRYLDRIRYWYPFQDKAARDSVIGKCLRIAGVHIQRAAGVNRLKKDVTYGLGSQFFDITDEFAKYVLDRRAWIDSMFEKTFCSDELFLQTVYLNSPFYQNDRFRYHSNDPKNQYIHSMYLDVRRAIDWTRGYPYVWRMDDKEILAKSNCLFARKFDERVDKEIIAYIYEALVSKNYG